MHFLASFMNNSCFLVMDICIFVEKLRNKDAAKTRLRFAFDFFAAVVVLFIKCKSDSNHAFYWTIYFSYLIPLIIYSRLLLYIFKLKILHKKQCYRVAVDENKENCCISSFLLHYLWIPMKIITISLFRD